MRCVFFASLAFLASLGCAQSAADKAKVMLQKMSLAEKINMLHGNKTSYTGGTPEIVNEATGVRIPPLNLNDGPQGYRSGGTTCWPSAMTVGATFDVELSLKWGKAMGQEFFDKGANVQLGPGMCVARVPVNGRNFECELHRNAPHTAPPLTPLLLHPLLPADISGEDPFLGFTMVQPLVKGIQSVGVIANAKHFIMNNQETNRGGMTAAVDERTRFEMYYPPFAGASEAGVGSIMCSCEFPARLATLCWSSDPPAPPARLILLPGPQSPPQTTRSRRKGSTSSASGPARMRRR